MVGRPRGVGAKCPGSVVPQVKGLGSCPATLWLWDFTQAWRPSFPICEMGLTGAACLREWM